MTRLLVIASLLALGWLATSALTAERAHGCAFSQTPNTYEGPRSRGPYLLGMELAAYNMIEPEDTFFGTPYIETGTRSNRRQAAEPYIPPTLLKAIGWIESAQAQAASSVPWSAVGPALVSFDCGHGIMQITSGMTSPHDGSRPSAQQSLVATHYLFNIGRGAAILAEKWNGAPEVRPIAGTDTDSSPRIVENWYFATWSYNGFTGPGANRSNHPRDPIYSSWPRTGFSCGSANDGYGHNYGNYPYQEIVFGCMARPPSVDGSRVWEPLDASLPDLNDSRWRDPLSLSNFTSSDWFRRMDMPSPRPTHEDSTAQPGNNVAGFLRSTPELAVSRSTLSGAGSVTISNPGGGILAWRVRTSNGISVNKQAGVALASDVPCASGAPCERSPRLQVTPNASTGWVDIESLTTGEVRRINVISAAHDVNCDGSTNALDAALILQHSAGLVESMPCAEAGDANGDGSVNVIDAAAILRLAAGL